MSDYTLGKKIEPDKPAPGPEWTRCKDRKGFWQHRDPPHHLRYAPDAWEQAQATLEDEARRGISHPWPNYSHPFPTIEDTP